MEMSGEFCPLDAGRNISDKGGGWLLAAGDCQNGLLFTFQMAAASLVQRGEEERRKPPLVRGHLKMTLGNASVQAVAQNIGTYCI